METENSGAPCPDNLKSNDNSFGEDDMETEDNRGPCPYELTACQNQAHLFKRFRKS